jgi:hypothetical protein
MVAPPPGGGPGSGNPYANGGMAGQKNAMYVGASGTNPNAWADRYKTEQTDFAGYGGYDFRAGPSKPLVPASQWRNDNGPSSGGDPATVSNPATRLPALVQAAVTTAAADRAASLPLDRRLLRLPELPARRRVRCSPRRILTGPFRRRLPTLSERRIRTA